MHCLVLSQSTRHRRTDRQNYDSQHRASIADRAVKITVIYHPLFKLMLKTQSHFLRHNAHLNHFKQTLTTNCRLCTILLHCVKRNTRRHQQSFHQSITETPNSNCLQEEIWHHITSACKQVNKRWSWFHQHKDRLLTTVASEEASNMTVKTKTETEMVKQLKHKQKLNWNWN